MVFQPNNEKTAFVENFNFKLYNIVFDKNTVKEKIPFRFGNHDIEAENIYFKADALQAFKSPRSHPRTQILLLMISKWFLWQKVT